MNRAARHCALILLPLAGTVLTTAPAARAQETPIAPTTPPAPQADRAPEKPQTVPEKPAGQPLQTPAQQRYGLPRNPIVGGSTDTDLSRPLSLDRAIHIGLQRQNSIAISKTEVDIANARLVQARSSYYPQVTPSLTYNSQVQPPTSTSFNGQTFTSSNNNETRTDGILAKQLIFDTGLREANVGNTRRTVFASEYGLGDQRQSVILSVTQAYYNLARSKELVRVNEESVRRAQTNLEVIQAQVAVGSAAKSDTLQAEADLANAQVTLLSSISDYNVNQATLKNVMGVVSSQQLVLTDDRLPAPAVEADPMTVDDYVKVAYDSRLDVKRQQEVINAQGYSVRAAIINNGVTVDASIQQGYDLDPNSGQNRLFSVAVSYPLFDGGNTRAVVKENRAQLEQDRRTLDQLEQLVRLDVEQSLQIREVARQRVAAAQTAVRAGQLNYDAALERQKNGLINILDVINAQLQLVTAQVSLVQAVYDFYIADAQLKRNIGVNDPEYVPHIPGAKPIRSALPPALQARLQAISAPANGTVASSTANLLQRKP